MNVEIKHDWNDTFAKSRQDDETSITFWHINTSLLYFYHRLIK